MLLLLLLTACRMAEVHLVLLVLLTWLFAKVARLVGAVHVHGPHKTCIVTRLATYLHCTLHITHTVDMCMRA